MCIELVGVGKTHKDAASVRATHPIPASCGIYYFEVRIISKGRDGYVSQSWSSIYVVIGSFFICQTLFFDCRDQIE